MRTAHLMSTSRRRSANLVQGVPAMRMAVNADKIGVCSLFDFWCQVVRVVRPVIYAAFQGVESSRCAILARLERNAESSSVIFRL